MKILPVMAMSLLVLVTGCSDNVEFGKKSPSSKNPEGQEGSNFNGQDQEDGFSGPDAVDLDDPFYFNVKKQTTTLNILHRKKKVDILFVVDNSGSMEEEQKKISQRLTNFISQLKDIDWHLGITTTSASDNFSNKNWSNGQLVPLGQNHYLTSSMSPWIVEDLFFRNITRNESGSDHENGIYATYKTIERYLSPKTYVDYQIRSFLRQDASLAVIVISDEDESSDFKKNNPDSLIGFIGMIFGPDKLFQFHSIIAYTEDCINRSGHEHGQTYEELSVKTGGVIGDICSNDYSGILSVIGHQVFNSSRIYNLACTPIDANNNGILDMKITTGNSSSKIPSFTILNGNMIRFDEDLSQDQYQLTYHCSKTE